MYYKPKLQKCGSGKKNRAFALDFGFLPYFIYRILQQHYCTEAMH